MTTQHHVLLPRTPWAGPSAFQIRGEEAYIHRGRMIDPPLTGLAYELRVDDHAKDLHAFPPLDLHDAGKGHLLMSSKLIACLKQLPVANLQLFPAAVVYLPTGQEVDYQVVNILGLVSALDTNASDCQLDDDGFVEGFDTLVLDEKRAGDHDLFRLYESFHTIVVSQRLRDCLEEAAITGMQLLRQDEWRPGML